MPRNPGCWANALDDCAGPLTGEHTLAVVVWNGVNGEQNRRARLRRRVDVANDRHHPQPNRRGVTVRSLTRDILCDFHNGSSNELDNAAGDLARALDGFYDTKQAREALPQLTWARREYRVDGLRLQRWFFKSVINAQFGSELPIGDAAGRVGWPTPELVEMVFGRRPVVAPFGLFLVTAEGHKHRLGIEEFSFIPFDRNGTHIAGSLLQFRSLHFGVNLEAVAVTDSTFDGVPGLEGSAVLQPFRGMGTGVTNVHLVIDF